ncbi:PREDICTED: dentin sialophosphoprotein-like isoform X2 [Branchiostoma belcheri]|uniref:Dentin sialophosphoprotein-like isoform X2 n=1 Tax=Branchiostoma belcheri TaxID=7741 RepID=A0A6P4YZE1_BRABE|nr:PREDICTED: dentin sialophosphoprotein-like isoform X2 [Branchiostoma belcheri]
MGKKTQTRTSPVTSAAGNSPPTIPDGPDMDGLSQTSLRGRKHRSRGREKCAGTQEQQNTSTRPKAASTVVKEENQMGTSNGTGAALSTDHGAAGRGNSSRKRRKTRPGEQGQGDTDENNTALGKQHSDKSTQKRAVRTEAHPATPGGAQGRGRGRKRKAPPGDAGRNDNKADKTVHTGSSSGSRPSRKKRRHSRGSSPAQGRPSTEGASCSSEKPATSDEQEVAATSRTSSKSKEDKKKGRAGKEKDSTLQTKHCKGNRTETKVTIKDGGTEDSSSSAKGQKRKKKKMKGSKTELGTEEARGTKTETAAEAVEAEKCAICLEELTDQRVGTPACCRHSYCLDCIQTWAQRKNKCPVDNKTFHEIVARERLGGAVTDRIPAPDRNEVHPEDDDDLFTINIDGEEVNILEQLNGYFLRYQEGWDHWADGDDDDDESGWVSIDEDGDDSDDDDDDEDDSDEDSYTDDTSEEERDDSDGGSYSASEGDWDTFFDDSYEGSYRGGSSPDLDSDSDSHDSSGADDDDDDETPYGGYGDYGPPDDYNASSPYSNQDGSFEEASGHDDDQSGYDENGDYYNDGYNNEYGDDGYDAYNGGYCDPVYHDSFEFGGYDHGYNDQSNNGDYYDDGYGNDYSDSYDQDSNDDSDSSSSDW